MTPILTATGNRTFFPAMHNPLDYLSDSIQRSLAVNKLVSYAWSRWHFRSLEITIIKNSGNMNNLIILRNLTAHNGYSTCRPCMLNNIWLCGLYEYSTAHELFITSRSTPLDEISRGCSRKPLQTRSLGQPNVGWRHPTALARWACCRCLGCYAKVAKAKTVPETFSYVRGLLYFLFRNLM